VTATIQLTAEQIDQCISAYNDALWAGRTYSFDPVNTKFMTMEQLRKERLSILVGELAFAMFLRRNIGIVNRYEDILDCSRIWSTLPVCANHWTFQLKPAVAHRYMYVPWSELIARKDSNTLPHSYVMFETEWSEEFNEPTGKVRFYGMISLSKILHKHSELFITRGDTPGQDTLGPLPADCYRVNKITVSEDWGHNIYHCLKKNPQDTSKYPAPYILSC